jgi:hypothetical protein
LVGLGGSLGLSGVISSGAFSSVSVNRDITVSVAEDRQAYLRLTQRGSGRRSYYDGSTIGFDIPSPDEDDYGGTDPKGVGQDSIYRFGQDAGGDETGLFGITNQGTQPVQVYSSQAETVGKPEVTIYDVESGKLLTKTDPSPPLGVGNQLICGLEIDTHDVSAREEEYDITLTINATAGSI